MLSDMSSSFEPERDEGSGKSASSYAQGLDIQTKFNAYIALISAKIWADGVFSRSRSFAVCSALVILPFILIAGYSKSAPILLMACILLVPSVIGLAFANASGFYTALRIQFFLNCGFAIGALSSDLGSGVALTLIALNFIDFLVFAPKQSLESISTRLCALGVIAFTCVYVGFTEVQHPKAIIWAGYLVVIPVLTQIGFGLFKLRFSESGQKTSTPVLSSIDSLALQASDELALIIDKSGRVVSAGANATRILGASCDDILGRGLFERLHPVDRPSLLVACSQMHLQSEDIPLRLTTGNIETSTLPLQYVLFTARMSQICQITGLIMLREVLAQQSFDMRFQASKNHAENKEQDDAIQRAKLLSEISHDARTPLNAIMGFSELLCDLSKQPKSAGAIAEYGQIINRSSKDLLEVVTHLIDLTRLENGVFKMAPETLTPMDVLDHLGVLISQKLDTTAVHISLSGELHTVDWTVDKRAARQILTTVAIALLNKTHIPALKIDVSVVNSTLCFSLSCPKNSAENSRDWQLKPITGLHISLEITRILAKLMGGQAEIKLSESGRQIAEVHFPLEGASTTQGGTDLVQLSKFRDSKNKPAPHFKSNSQVKKHA